MIWYVLLALYCSTVCLLFFFFDKVASVKKRSIKYRLDRYLQNTSDHFLDDQTRSSLPKQLISWIKLYIEAFTPNMYKIYLKKKLQALDQRYTLQDILFIKCLLTVLIVGCAAVYNEATHFRYLPVSLLAILASYFLPDFLLYRSGEKQRVAILEQLPFFIDLLVILMETGISFDNAVQKICEKKIGTLYSHLRQYIQENRMGVARKDALSHLADRIQLAEISSLVRAIIQSEKMGVSMTTVIRLQAEQMRSQRSQRIREQAMKMPVKILFPLVFFIFPPIFIVILGPAAILVFQSLFH